MEQHHLLAGNGARCTQIADRGLVKPVLPGKRRMPVNEGRIAAKVNDPAEAGRSRSVRSEVWLDAGAGEKTGGYPEGRTEMGRFLDLCNGSFVISEWLTQAPSQNDLAKGCGIQSIVVFLQG